MIVKIKKLNDKAIIPTYAKEGDAAMDLTATGMEITKSYLEFKTGLAVEIPEGYFGLVRPRSSISKTMLEFNTSGIIDSGYRGELIVRFKINYGYSREAGMLAIGERVAQLVILPYPKIEFQEVLELSDSERGERGHGHTGK